MILIKEWSTKPLESIFYLYLWYLHLTRLDIPGSGDSTNWTCLRQNEAKKGQLSVESVLDPPAGGLSLIRHCQKKHAENYSQ